ncbi:hypothetical protein NM688_g7454 [Phlebia brevispora]|uniref:Uncharacterized protein n=1 Tax=Phlebia brevispora TaxID=194682 RepID=A0ACC1S4Y2_9APHY|nr:hypothetical protein NM688_g7454 [Phlebia brevispora]
MEEYEPDTSAATSFLALALELGYIIALALDAVIRFQSTTRHQDPVHLTAHFLSSATVGPCEVHVRIIKLGKGAFTTLAASFIQKGQEKVKLHFVFGNLSVPESHKTTRPDMTVEPPPPYAAQIPVQNHPSKCSLLPEQPKWHYLAEQQMKLARDPMYDELLWKPGPMEACNYVTLTDKNEQLSYQMLPVFADIFLTFAAKNPKLPSWTFWCPTIVFTMEFKFPLPKPGTRGCASRTVAAYHKGRFLNEPHGRHETYMEVWTAPANIGDGPETEIEGWRDHQRCLAIAYQMHIMVDVDAMPGGSTKQLKTTSWTPPKL